MIMDFPLWCKGSILYSDYKEVGSNPAKGTN